MLKKLFTRPNVSRVKPKNIMSRAPLYLNRAIAWSIFVITFTVLLVRWFDPKQSVDWLWTVGMTIIALNILLMDYAFPFRDKARHDWIIYFSVWVVGTFILFLHPILEAIS